MINRFKRFLSLVLVALMFLNIMPTDVLAEQVFNSDWSNAISTYASTADYQVKVGEKTRITGSYNSSWKLSSTSATDVVKLTSRNQSTVTVEGLKEGTVTLINSSYWGSTEYTVEVVPATWTVTFNANGGRGTVPAPITVERGETITLPQQGYLSRYGMVFGGWSAITNPNDSGKYKPGNNGTIYEAGGEYLPQDDITLYAVWSEQNVKATFFIRLDGTIPTEPQGHDVSEYTDGVTINGALKVAQFYFNSSGVDGMLNSKPTDSQIKNDLAKEEISYNPYTQYVLWYVIKSEEVWHVDGVLLDKAKVNLAYEPNAPAGTWANMPDGQQYTVGATATVSGKVPTRTGYTFTGWNTEKDGTGTALILMINS